MAYLAQEYEKAQEYLTLAKSVAPPRTFEVVSGTIPSGIERLAASLNARRTLTPKEVLHAKHPEASLVLQLADLYGRCEELSKSIALCDRILRGDLPATSDQKSWALFRRARGRFGSFCGKWDRRDVLAAKKDYLAAARLAPKSPWAYRGVFLAGNIAFNTEHDVDGAVSLWRVLLERYPNCSEAHRAAYYVGVVYELTKQPRKARVAYDAFMKRFPDSPFVELVRREHLKNLDVLGERGNQ